MNIAEVLMYLHPDSQFGEDWEVTDDGSGQRITAWNLADEMPTISELSATYDTLEFKDWRLAKTKARIDRDTGAAINRVVHPQCGDTETLGILRHLLVQWGNELGLEFTPDMIRLNEIAIAEIEKGITRKEAL